MPATDPDGTAPRLSPEPPPDAGTVELVAGTATGLRREVGRMADGRRITYYWSAPDSSAPGGSGRDGAPAGPR